jgi:hypothetical protein
MAFARDREPDDPGRWVKIQEIFAEALEREPAEGSTYLTGVCTDTSLRNEVELMIAAHEQGGTGGYGGFFLGCRRSMRSTMGRFAYSWRIMPEM